MGIPVHIICGKCGSLEVEFSAKYDDAEKEINASFFCHNCCELTDSFFVNDWKRDKKELPNNKKEKMK